MAIPIQGNIHDSGWALLKNTMSKYVATFALGIGLAQISGDSEDLTPAKCLTFLACANIATGLSYGYRKCLIVKEMTRDYLPQSRVFQILTNPVLSTSIQCMNNAVSAMALYNVATESKSAEWMVPLSAALTGAALLPGAIAVVSRSLDGLQASFNEGSLKNGLVHLANIITESTAFASTLLFPGQLSQWQKPANQETSRKQTDKTLALLRKTAAEIPEKIIGATRIAHLLETTYQENLTAVAIPDGQAIINVPHIHRGVAARPIQWA